MTSETPTPTQPHIAGPYGSPSAGYATPARPPLTKRAKKGAFWGGAVGFNVLTIGFGLVVLPILAAIVGAFFSFLFTQVERNSDYLGTGYLAVRGLFASIDFGIVVVIGVVVFLAGLAIMTGALFASKAILRSHGVHRAWAVTWAGAGIAIVASWVVGWIPGVVVQFASGLFPQGGSDGFAALAALGGFGMILGIATTAVIGWLAWWWMAHAFRPSFAASPGGGTTAEESQR